MKTKLVYALFICFSQLIFSQQNDQRFIEVVGSAEMDVEPDEIIFEIGLEEYWEEEYEAGKHVDDYITKVPLKDIEEELLFQLAKLGVKKSQIRIKEVGKYWRYSGKNFDKSKLFEITSYNIEKINEILLNVSVKGVNSMRIVKFKNKDLLTFRKQVKIEAMKASKQKATYLLESVGEEVGHVISVVENDEQGRDPFRSMANITSNARLESADSDMGIDEVNKIHIKYNFTVRYAIK